MWSRASLALSCLLTIAACSTDGSEPIAEGEATSTEETSEGSETEESGVEDGPCPEDDAPADAPSFAWRVELDSSYDDVIGQLAIDAEGRVHVVGWRAEPYLPPESTSPPPRTRAFVTVYSAEGEQLSGTQWEASGGFDGNVDVTRPTELVIAPTGERYVAGRTNARIAGVGGLNGDSAFVAQLAADGSPAWIRMFDAFDESSYDAPEALTLSPTGELYFAWGHAETEPSFGFGLPRHRLSRLSSSGELEAEIPLDLGDSAHVNDLATDCEGEVVFIAGRISPPYRGFLARVSRKLEPLGLSLSELGNSEWTQVEVNDAGVYVLGSGAHPQLGDDSGWFGRYDLQAQLQWSELASHLLTGLAPRGRGFVSSNTQMRMLELGEPDSSGWELDVPEQGGGAGEITRIATSPDGRVAVAGRYDNPDEDHEGAFVALFVP